MTYYRPPDDVFEINDPSGTPSIVGAGPVTLPWRLKGLSVNALRDLSNTFGNSCAPQFVGKGYWPSYKVTPALQEYQTTSDPTDAIDAPNSMVSRTTTAIDDTTWPETVLPGLLDHADARVLALNPAWTAERAVTEQIRGIGRALKLERRKGNGNQADEDELDATETVFDAASAIRDDYDAVVIAFNAASGNAAKQAVRAAWLAT